MSERGDIGSVGRSGIFRAACAMVGWPKISTIGAVICALIALFSLIFGLYSFFVVFLIPAGIFWFIIYNYMQSAEFHMLKDIWAKLNNLESVEVSPEDTEIAAKTVGLFQETMVRTRGFVDDPYENVRIVPTIKQLVSKPRGVELGFSIPTGLDVGSFDKTKAYADSFEVESVTMRRAAPGIAAMTLETGRDPLLEKVSWHALPPAAADTTGALPAAVSENGNVLTLQQAHALFLGATGSGKGSTIWAIVRALLPAAEQGLVNFIGCDSKANEIKEGESIFCDVAYYPSDHSRVFADVAELIDERGKEHTGREFTATKDQPLTVLIIDEITSLTSLFKDSKEQKSALADLRKILSLGRSRGILVIGAGQDPNKESLPLRNLFPQIVALRLQNATETRTALGDAAEESGADPHNIEVADRSNDYKTAGIGFVREETGRLVRCRFPYASDADIAAMAGLISHRGHNCQTAIQAVTDSGAEP